MLKFSDGHAEVTEEIMPPLFRRNGLAELASLESADFGLEPPQVGRRTFSD